MLERDPLDYTRDESISPSVNRDFRVGGNRGVYTAELTLIDAVGNARGVEALSAFLGSLEEGARKVYQRGWKHWVRFRRGYDVEPWPTPGRVGWGALMLKFITHEHSVLKLHPSRIRGKIAAVRFHHIIGDRSDFTTQGVRYKQLLKSLVRKSPAFRKLRISPEILI